MPQRAMDNGSEGSFLPQTQSGNNDLPALRPPGAETPSGGVGGSIRRTLGRGTYRAFRLSNVQVAIVAEGTLTNFNDQADLAQSPLRIFPPRFELFFLQQ